MSLELELEKLEKKKELLEAQWETVKNELIEGGLKIEDSNFDDFIIGLKELYDKYPNKLFGDMHTFSKRYHSNAKLHYNTLKIVVAGLEGLIEEHRSLIDENKPLIDIYLKIKEECDGKSIEVYVAELKSKIEDFEKQARGLEESLKVYETLVDDIKFGVLMLNDYDSLIEWINKVAARHNIDLKVGKKQVIAEKEVVKEEEKISVEYNYVFEEGKAKFIEKMKWYLGLTEKQKKDANKPSLVLFVSGICNRDRVPKEQGNSLKDKARKIEPDLIDEVMRSNVNEQPIVESGVPPIIDKEIEGS